MESEWKINEKANELKIIEWQNKNIPKFLVKEKIGVWIVFKPQRFYKFQVPRTQDISDFRWEYECLNTFTGEVKQLREEYLTLINEVVK